MYRLSLICSTSFLSIFVCSNIHTGLVNKWRMNWRRKSSWKTPDFIVYLQREFLFSHSFAFWILMRVNKNIVAKRARRVEWKRKWKRKLAELNLDFYYSCTIVHHKPSYNINAISFVCALAHSRLFALSLSPHCKIHCSVWDHVWNAYKQFSLSIYPLRPCLLLFIIYHS